MREALLTSNKMPEMEDAQHHFLQYTRAQLEGSVLACVPLPRVVRPTSSCMPCRSSRDKLRSRAMDLRDALGLTDANAPLPATSAQLVEWILTYQVKAPEVDHSHEVSALLCVRGHICFRVGMRACVRTPTQFSSRLRPTLL